MDPVRLKQCLLDLLNSTTRELNSDEVVLNVGSNENKEGDDHWITFEIVHRSLCDSVEAQEHGYRNYWQRIQTILNQERPMDQHPNGADLGLMIAYKLATLLGGHLQLVSSPHESIRLSLTLPAGMAGRPVERVSGLHRHQFVQPAPPFEEVRRFSGRVLVADDDKVDRRVIFTLLKKCDVEIVMVGSGKEVLQETRKNKYDLLIVDMLMPDMDGCEVTRRLRADGLNTPIIAITGNVMKPEIDACMAAGYTEHLPKPIAQAQLAEVLSRYLVAAEQALQPVYVSS